MAEAAGPLQRYLHLLETGDIQPDPAQRQIVTQLDDRFQRLKPAPSGLLTRWRKPPRVRGLYLHGQVGRGKTMLMDLLAHSLDQAQIPVWRIHFHRFLDQIHQQLNGLSRQRNPLQQVADQIANRARVLCFDEFHVGDIGDAMILGELLQALFARRVVLITTSNCAPGELYADGLQRARFLPAIAAIEAHCEVCQLDAPTDYRLRELVRHPVYYWPDDAAARSGLAEEFRNLASGETISTTPLKVRGRQLQPLRRAGPVAWFDFATLCGGPRSSADYIELAKRFGTLIVSEVPQLNDDDNNAARRLIHLVDECYDRAVKLIMAADVPPESLYRGQRLAAPFQRTVSRLTEMQSHDYLALPHRP